MKLKFPVGQTRFYAGKHEVEILPETAYRECRTPYYKKRSKNTFSIKFGRNQGEVVTRGQVESFCYPVRTLVDIDIVSKWGDKIHIDKGEKVLLSKTYCFRKKKSRG